MAINQNTEQKQQTSGSGGDQADGATRSTFSAPSISLPKGGGAIRGINEKFAANPVTGTGSLTIPIATSPGRSGFGPQLSVTYDSGSGNGIFGMGWSLSQPGVTRRTDKGIPRYHDNEESDIFILSGAEDLVPVLIQDAKGQWVFDEFLHHGHRIKRYRPRIEGLFARIERWTSLESGEVHWRSITKDNVLTVYGFDAGSRIADPENPHHVFSWLICRSYDDKGNAILYDYAAENNDGIDFTKPNERSRIRSANRYPKRIRYGNRVPLLLDPDSPSFRRSHIEPHELDAAQWMFEVVFDYGEGHYREEPPDEEGRILAHASTESSRESQIRRDPFSSYRSAFEIRTYRLCRRVLMFHHFPEELGTESYLVRSTDFHYHEKPVGSFITRVVQSGHKLREDGRYLTRSLPPLDLSYTTSPLEDPHFEDFRLKDVDQDSLANLPGGIDGGTYRWLDLDGEGISGVLTEQDDAWFYKPNLGDGRFGSTETVKARPSRAALNEGTSLLIDVAGDGNLDLVDLSPSAAGFHERTLDAGWEGFRAFRSLPVRDWGDPNLRFVDLTGDGLADVLVTEDNALTWHPSLLKEGFGPGLRVRMPTEEEKGPRIVFADGDQSVYLADMSGDGLSDILRIRNGEICYWPNLGYGQFGAKITMDNAPRFDEPDLFDQSRIRLADTDGSGTSDIIYLGKDGVRIFLNETGNGWSSARHLRWFPAVDDVGSITVTDFLGRGTACLLWSSPLPREAGRQLRYVDLMCGQKPHLLTSTVNNLGAETRIEYASSTEFYLPDKAVGTPWVTKLPFPVHVVKRVETYDYVSRNRFVTRYTYHHGFYDGVEREFRGFGRVDQFDTEELAILTASGDFPVGDNIDTASNVPPVLTKSWFHTGVYPEGESVSRHLAHEYYQEGAGRTGETRLSPGQIQAMLLNDTILPDHLTPEEAREACRSLKGAMLRQEVYALDGKEESCRPYTVAESNYTIRTLQRRQTNRYAVFFTHARESLSFHYERKLYEVNGRQLADPRVTHAMVLAVDDFGNELQSVAIGYGRRRDDPDPLLTAGDRALQKKTHITFTESAYTNPILADDAYRTPLPAEARTYELLKIVPGNNQPDITNLFGFDELVSKVGQAGDGLHDLPYEDVAATGATANHPYRRLIEHVRTLYRRSDLTGPLPLGQLDSLAIPFENYKLAFTPGLLTQVYGNRVIDAMLLNEGRYVHSEGDANWWVSSGRMFLSPGGADMPAQELAYGRQHFFLPHRLRDSFGNVASVGYDAYDLLVQQTTDPLGNTASADHEYRLLQPFRMTDPNGNRAEVAFDTLGLVAGTAVMGKTTETKGDSLAGFVPDLAPQQRQDFLADPLGHAALLLGQATTRIVYDLDRYLTTQQPAFTATLARETHVSDPLPPDGLKIQVHLSYSDGFGREIQKKIQAEPGPVSEGGPIVSPRWVGSGWTIFNNKGKPVRQYEPFFDNTHDFKFGVAVGVSPVLFYDPVERVIATLHPNHTYEKVVFDPWQQTTYDVNDTVTFDPKTDDEVKEFFTRLPEADFLPTWYGQRSGGQMGSKERDAATKAAVHANTPTVAYFDSLGRPFLTIAHNKFDRRKLDNTIETIEEKYSTRVELDIEGNQREVIDAKDRVVMRYDYDLLGIRIHQASMEAGERWMLNDVATKPLYAWDSRDHRFRTAYDPLRRPTDAFLSEGASAEIVIGRRIYGENHPDYAHPQANNLRGRLVELRDQAGIVISDDYDFKGNPLRSQRQFAREYKTLDWNAGVPLEAEVYTSNSRFDALNRPTEQTTPDNSVYRPTYNEANLLDKVDINLRGAATATAFVSNVDYDAKGRRVLIEYGNGVRTTYAYDPLTFRLTRLTTTRPAGLNGLGTQLFKNAATVQQLSYTYDPAGNITRIADDALPTLFFANQQVEPVGLYTYDALYRLIEAQGRESIGQSALQLGLSQATYRNYPYAGLGPQPFDPKAVRNYTEQYRYDEVGNFQNTIHQAFNGGWQRDYRYEEQSLIELAKFSNRLSGTVLHPKGSAVDEDYTHDAHGNMTSMPHLTLMQWDFRDQLQTTARQAVSDGTPETTYYIYDAVGQRVRKVTERQNGMRKNERTYLGGFEVYREYGGNGSSVNLERESLHVTGDKQRIALVETRTQGNDASPAQLIRYQLGNHLGSASLELDDAGQIISYEEYTPYGSTLYQTGRNAAEVSLKRYRYTGMERDGESGFDYHQARYYISWLGRWTAPDPALITFDVQVYSYASANPVRLVDLTGFEPVPPRPCSSCHTPTNNPPPPRPCSACHKPTSNPSPLQDYSFSFSAPRFGVTPTPIDVRKVRPDTVSLIKDWGLAGDATSTTTPVEHVLAEHATATPGSPYTDYTDSPYLSSSEKYPFGASKPDPARGLPGFEGSRIYIDRNRAIAEGAGYITNRELARQVEAWGVANPEQVTRAESWINNQPRELEGLYRGEISPKAILRTGSHIALRGLQIYSYGMTAYDMSVAVDQSIKTGSGRPIVKESIRQVSSYGGAAAGVWIGVEAGLWCGPAFIVCSAVGGAVGYWAGDKIAGLIDDPISTGNSAEERDDRRSPTLRNVVNKVTGWEKVDRGMDQMYQELDRQARSRH